MRVNHSRMSSAARAARITGSASASGETWAFLNAQVACFNSNAPDWRMPDFQELAKPPQSSTCATRPGGSRQPSAAWVCAA